MRRFRTGGGSGGGYSRATKLALVAFVLTVLWLQFSELRSIASETGGSSGNVKPGDRGRQHGSRGTKGRGDVSYAALQGVLGQGKAADLLGRTEPPGQGEGAVVVVEPRHGGAQHRDSDGSVMSWWRGAGGKVGGTRTSTNNSGNGADDSLSSGLLHSKPRATNPTAFFASVYGWPTAYASVGRELVKKAHQAGKPGSTAKPNPNSIYRRFSMCEKALRLGDDKSLAPTYCRVFCLRLLPVDHLKMATVQIPAGETLIIHLERYRSTGAKDKKPSKAGVSSIQRGNTKKNQSQASMQLVVPAGGIMAPLSAAWQKTDGAAYGRPAIGNIFIHNHLKFRFVVDNSGGPSSGTGTNIVAVVVVPESVNHIASPEEIKSCERRPSALEANVPLRTPMSPAINTQSMMPFKQERLTIFSYASEYIPLHELSESATVGGDKTDRDGNRQQDAKSSPSTTAMRRRVVRCDQGLYMGLTNIIQSLADCITIGQLCSREVYYPLGLHGSSFAELFDLNRIVSKVYAIFGVRLHFERGPVTTEHHVTPVPTMLKGIAEIKQLCAWKDFRSREQHFVEDRQLREQLTSNRGGPSGIFAAAHSRKSRSERETLKRDVVAALRRAEQQEDDVVYFGDVWPTRFHLKNEKKQILFLGSVLMADDDILQGTSDAAAVGTKKADSAKEARDDAAADREAEGVGTGGSSSADGTAPRSALGGGVGNSSEPPLQDQLPQLRALSPVIRRYVYTIMAALFKQHADGPIVAAHLRFESDQWALAKGQRKGGAKAPPSAKKQRKVIRRQNNEALGLLASLGVDASTSVPITTEPPAAADAFSPSTSPVATNETSTSIVSEMTLRSLRILTKLVGHISDFGASVVYRASGKLDPLLAKVFNASSSNDNRGGGGGTGVTWLGKNDIFGGDGLSRLPFHEPFNGRWFNGKPVQVTNSTGALVDFFVLCYADIAVLADYSSFGEYVSLARCGRDPTLKTLLYSMEGDIRQANCSDQILSSRLKYDKAEIERLRLKRERREYLAEMRRKKKQEGKKR